MTTARQLPPELMQALGEIVVRWSFLEAMLIEFLAFLLKTEHGFIHVMAQTVSGASVVSWIRITLALHGVDAAVLEATTILLDRIDRTRVERNKLVHGTWKTTTDAQAVEVQTVRFERGEILQGTIVTLADLKETIHEIGELTRIMANIADAHGFLGKRKAT